MAVPPKVLEDMQQVGGRHYRGRGLGSAQQAWKCPGCGYENVGRIEQGCSKCGAGKPGQQVRKPGDPVAKVGGAPERPVVRSESTGSRPAPPTGSLAEQLRRRAAPAANVDYDEIERRLHKALEERLGGGYNPIERVTLYNALECYITLWDEGTIQPAGGLSLEETRLLAQRVAPEDGLEMADGEGTTASAAEEQYIGDPDGDPATRGYEHGDISDGDNPDDGAGAATLAATRISVRPAPQLLNPDHRGDEGGEDDATGDGS